MQQRALIIAVICLASVYVTVAARAKPLVVAFGDSLTDNGNFFNGLGQKKLPLPTVFWKGRFTNAPGTWADQLHSLNKQVQAANFAYGGALACQPKGLPPPIDLIPDLAEQIELFSNKSKSNSAFKKTLSGRRIIPVVFTGHNDLELALTLPPAQAAQIPAQVLQCILGGVNSLLAAGHKSVVLASLAPLNLSPLAADNNVTQLATPIVQLINTQLKAGAQQLQAKYNGSQVVFWDLATVVTNVIENPKKYGFKYTTPRRCVVGGDAVAGIKPQSVCKDPQNYIFYDHEHPTSRMHRVVARSMIDTLKAAGWLHATPKKGRL